MSYRTEDTGATPNFCLFGKIGQDPENTYAMAECYILDPSSDQPQAEVGHIVTYKNIEAARRDAHITSSVVRVFFDEETVLFERKGRHAILTNEAFPALGKCMDGLREKPTLPGSRLSRL